MTQKSWPWSTAAALGDGATELGEAASREFLALYFGIQDPAVEGVSKGVLGELEVSGASSPLSVQPGSAICYGLYASDAVVTPSVSTPAIGTTGGRVVLQTNWAGTGGGSLEARTRLAVKMSSDGVASIPALTQSFGTTWEISLATFTITTGGAITVTDDRTFRRSTAVVDTDELIDLAATTPKIDNDAVTDAKLRHSSAYSVIGRSASSAGEPGDIAAGSDEFVLRRRAGSLSFGQLFEGSYSNQSIPTAAIQNDAVDDTKAGNRVPQFYRRQGGSATNWSTPGTSTQTPGAVRMQAGNFTWSGAAATGGSDTVTFPAAFSNVPLVLIIPQGSNGKLAVSVQVLSATDFTFTWNNVLDAQQFTSANFIWLAIGPE